MIASWMVYALIVGGLLALAGRAAEWALRLLGRPGRFVWILAGLGAVMVPFATALRPAPAVVPAVASTDAPATAPPPPPESWSFGATLPVIPSAPTLDRPLLLVWAGGSLLLLIALAHGLGVLRGRRREWRLVELDGREVLVARDVGPAVIGWRRMRIVVPVWALSLDPESRGMILAHEEEHIRRGDPRLLLAGLLAAVLMPWNVPLWYCYRRLRLAIELDCDARVVARGADRRRYGEILLAAGRHASSGGLPALATFAERAEQLETRISALAPVRIPRRGTRIAGAAAMAGLLFAVACTLDNPLGAALTDPTIAPLVQARRPFASGEGVEGVRNAVLQVIDAHYPGAGAAGGTPREVVVALILDHRRRITRTWLTTIGADRSGAASPISELPTYDIDAIEVFKGNALNLENVGVIVISLRDPDAPPRDPERTPSRADAIRVRPSPVPYTELPVGSYRQFTYPDRTTGGGAVVLLRNPPGER